MNEERMQLQYIEEDVIDLRKLWLTIAQGKFIIFGSVFVVTLASLIYVWLLEPIKPLYEASVLIEIGKIIDKDKNSVTLTDNAYSLKNIIDRIMDITVVVPIHTNSILLLSSLNSKEELAKQELQDGVSFILKRHQEIAVNYKKVRIPRVFGEVKVIDIAKQPKKKQIVTISFVSSLIFSLFLVFFLDFIKNNRKEV